MVTFGIADSVTAFLGYGSKVLDTIYTSFVVVTLVRLVLAKQARYPANNNRHIAKEASNSATTFTQTFLQTLLLTTN